MAGEKTGVWQVCEFQNFCAEHLFRVFERVLCWAILIVKEKYYDTEGGK